MAEGWDPSDFSRFEQFHVLSTPYKSVYGHEITTSIVIPKHLLSEAAKTDDRGQPVIIRFHGGGLIAASSMFPPFFNPWLLELTTQESAVVVTPNYRLLPESTADDIMDDVEDFWNWTTGGSLEAYLAKELGGKLKIDLGRILTAGESAGGYLSLQLSLSHADKIRAVTAQYPMVDIKGPAFWEKREKGFFGVPMLPESTVPDHVAKVKEQEALLDGSGQTKIVVSDDIKGDRLSLVFALFQQGSLRDCFDSTNKLLFPLERIEAGEKFPRGGVFVWHGTEDSLVFLEGSQKLELAVRKNDPELYFKLTTRPGEHGFDGETKLQEPWVTEGLKPLLDSWLV